jgi:hypothetical protein
LCRGPDHQRKDCPLQQLFADIDVFDESEALLDDGE